MKVVRGHRQAEDGEGSHSRRVGGSGGRHRRIEGDDLHERGSGGHCVGGGLGFWASGDAGDRLTHLLLKDGEARTKAPMTARRSTKGGPPHGLPFARSF